MVSARWEGPLPVEREMAPKGMVKGDSGGWGWWGVALAGGEAAGCKGQGGGKPKCICNPAWGFSDFSFESLWLGVCGVCRELCVAFLTPAQESHVRAAALPSACSLQGLSPSEGVLELPQAAG